MTNSCHIRSGISPETIPVDWIADQLPAGDFRYIVLKPNWVHHEVSSSFPIQALITSPALIDAVIQACLLRYPAAESITVGDVPLQSCDFNLMMKQSGTDQIIEKWRHHSSPRITFRDWRRERFELKDGFMARQPPGDYGDPEGYREVMLDEASFLDPISGKRERFRVSDYDVERIQSSHRQGFHRYLIAGSALKADLFINLPKMKTHQKSGLTGALKNLVGCNGEKAYLVHYLKGRNKNGGDEFPSSIAWPILLQVRVREALQKRSKMLFALLRPAWRLMKKVYGINTEGTQDNLKQGTFYLAAGAWYGNDTIWRMVYDLNMIIHFASATGGVLKDQPQRTYLAIVDGMISGEGNGPLQPLPIQSRLIYAADNPLVADMIMAKLMGFDYRKIPCLSRFTELHDPEWSGIDPESIPITINGKSITGLSQLSPLRTYLPSPGWKDHIELEAIKPDLPA